MIHNINIFKLEPRVFRNLPLIKDFESKLHLPSIVLQALLSGHSPQYPGMYRLLDVVLVAHQVLPDFLR